MKYARLLKLTTPLMRGDDVSAVQRALLQEGFPIGGIVDGIYGEDTQTAVRQYQKSVNLPTDGLVGPKTWEMLFPESVEIGDVPQPDAGSVPQNWLAPLMVNHNFNNGVMWHLSSAGIQVDNGAPETSGGQPQTVERIWNEYGEYIQRWAAHYDVPAELIIATICTESSGDADATRMEPGYVSSDETPNRISVGLMQTLISTAREALNDDQIYEDWLRDPDNAIKAGTAYISQQKSKTMFDPPKVACAYNAGGVYPNDGPDNRWKMRQYPIGTGKHADRFVRWFNDCFRLFEQRNEKPANTFYEQIR